MRRPSVTRPPYRPAALTSSRVRRDEANQDEAARFGGSGGRAAAAAGSPPVCARMAASFCCAASSGVMSPCCRSQVISRSAFDVASLD